MRSIKDRRAAIELSMTTIIVVVLSLALLILGFVLVRNVMCGAITFSNSLNEKTDNEIARLFDTSTGELNCYGGGDEKIALERGTSNSIKCQIGSSVERDFRIKVEEITAQGGEISESELKSWIIGTINNVWLESVPPGDETWYKVIDLNIPEDASLVPIRVKITAQKKVGGEWKTATGSKDLDFEVKKIGAVRSVLC